MTLPASVPTNGTVRVVYLPTVSAIPKITELSGVTAKELACYLTGEGLNTDTSENNVEDARLCSKQTYEQPGDYTDTLEITYVFNTKVPTDDVARLTLPRGTKGFIVVRWAVDHDTSWTTGDIVDRYPITAGQQRKMTPARNGVHRIVQKLFVTGEVGRDLVTIAGP